MTTRRFDQLDVFSAVPLLGNPLAVLHDAAGLDEERMAAIARWTRLSETTFLLPPDDPQADYRVRIFTPGGELPFAGHPTLGSCHAWLAAGGRPRHEDRVVQQCGIGRVTIRRRDGRLAFAAPPQLRSGPLDEALLGQIARALSIDRGDIVQHQWCDNGPGWCAVMLSRAAQVLDLRPDAASMGTIKLGVVAPQPPGHGTHFEVRAFAPGLGVPEDPVTGSLNAALARWLIGAGLAPSRYVAAQGTAMGRAGRVHVEHDGSDFWVGGDIAPCIQGTITV